MKAKWIIEKGMDEDGNIRNAISSLGYEYTELEYIPFSRREDIVYPYNIDEIVIPYSTINLGRHLKTYIGSHLFESDLQFSNYSSKLNKIEQTYWLNDDFILTTFNDFRRRFHKYQFIFNSNELFIRPNSGSKLFTGLVVNDLNIDFEINSLINLSGVLDESIILVSRAKIIEAEYRFIIIGNDVIDGSLYNFKGEHIERSIFPPEAEILAKKVAQHNFHPIGMYTCDIAQTQVGYKIIEINSFNCAGWYKCDPTKIVKAASDYVEKEWKDLYGL